MGRWEATVQEALEHAAAGKTQDLLLSYASSGPEGPHDASPGESHPDRTTHMQAIPAEPHETVSAKIINQSDRHRATVDRALAAIDNVHVDGPLHPIPLTVTSEMRRAGQFETDPATRRGRSITIGRGAEHPELVILHEIGHFLDYDAIGGRGLFASESEEADALEIVTHIPYTRHFAELGELGTRRTISVQMEDGRRRSLRVNERYVSYLGRYEELFARAYTQYIVERSGDPVLTEQLAGERVARPGAIHYPLYWEPEDFKPVGEAFDELFRRKGWLK